MICPKCGTPNADDALTCARCGHKLQSRRKTAQAESASPEAGGDIGFWQEPRPKKHHFGRYVESWIYALILLGAVFWFVFEELYWPLYVICPVVGLWAWFRRL